MATMTELTDAKRGKSGREWLWAAREILYGSLIVLQLIYVLRMSRFLFPQQQQQSDSAFCTLTIVATAVESDGTLVCAIAVRQPVQNWTVIRSHAEFVALGQDLPACVAPCPEQNANILEARTQMQDWLANVLTKASGAAVVRSFLTVNADVMPPQYDGLSWTHYSPILVDRAPTNPAATTNVDDMDMDDMFMCDEASTDDVDVGEYPIIDEQDTVPSAAVRYQPTNEPVTEEDEMEIIDLAGEVEMVEDIGSLAQSLGASHLGRSLKLQAEMRHHKVDNQLPVQGLHIRGASNQGSLVGGIGGAMERARTSDSGSNGSNTPSPPTRLDAFKLIKVIGKGSFGKVFLVKEHTTAKIYALKVLRKDNIIKRNQVEHTRTERNVLGYVKHPFIVGMNMAFQSKDKLYFVLDYCAGGELFFHLGKIGKFPEPRACFYAAEIIMAISYVHSLDIIYRDLKPENVLLTAEGHIRLTDFGLSKEGISGSSSGANSFCGTPEYLPPEILNKAGHGRAVDWWSLGALLYEMLTSLPPFYCQDRHRLFEQIKNCELSYPDSMSRAAKNLLKGLLTKDPKKRLGSGSQDAEDIKVCEFFGEIDWDKLSTGDVTPPWKPSISDKLDTSQFDKEFTSMPVFSPKSLTGCHGFGSTPGRDNLFEGFTFTDRRFYGPGTEAGV